MTCIFLCHFPGGARSGIIAPRTDARLPPEISGGRVQTRWNTGVLANSKAAECREAPVFDERDQWLASCRRRKLHLRIMPARHGDRAGYHQAKYMPLKFSPQLPMGRQATPVEP
jgi:hypothetical protein